MMKLTDYQGEDALDLLADILDPVTEIFGDEDFKKATQGNASNMKIVKILLKNHKKAIIEIMARIEGVEPSEYKCNVLTLPLALIELFNSKEFADLFTLQGKNKAEMFFGSAMENIEEKEK